MGIKPLQLRKYECCGNLRMLSIIPKIVWWSSPIIRLAVTESEIPTLPPTGIPIGAQTPTVAGVRLGAAVWAPDVHAPKAGEGSDKA